MNEHLFQIDNILMRLEDYIHGQDGEDITKARKIISELMNRNNSTSKCGVCGGTGKVQIDYGDDVTKYYEGTWQ